MECVVCDLYAANTSHLSCQQTAADWSSKREGEKENLKDEQHQKYQNYKLNMQFKVAYVPMWDLSCGKFLRVTSV